MTKRGTRISEAKYIKPQLAKMFENIDEMIKGLESENEDSKKYLKGKRMIVYDEILTSKIMLANIRIDQTLTLMNQVLLSLQYLAGVIDKKPSEKELGKLRQSFEKKFDSQNAKIKETLKPLSDGVGKTLERQKRGEGVYG